MRISFPIHNLRLGRGGGIETYARALVRYLQDIDDTNEYVLSLSATNEEAFPLQKNNFRKIVTGSKIKMISQMESAAYFIYEKVFEFTETKMLLRSMNRIAKKVIKGTYRKICPPREMTANSSYDIIHYLFTTLPYWQNFDVPVILTNHDIQQEYYPEFFSKDELENRRKLYRPSVEKADHIIAISQFTKKTLIEKYGTPEDKVSVVYNGYDEEAFKKLDEETVEKFRRKYDLPAHFLLYPAATWKHKNHTNLIRAFKILKEKHLFKKKLVLSGLKKENHGAVKGEVRKLGLRGDIIYLGYLPYEELPALFNAADILVFPSFFEGFGIPVIEAMATGLPVACSNATSLPEVAGDAALYFDPHDPEDIAEKVLVLHNNRDQREFLVKKGYERVKLFTWKCTARETLRVYENVYGTVKRSV